MNHIISYKHSYVSFLDILGFSEILTNPKTTAYEIYNILHNARESCHVDKYETDILGIRNIAITDCMIRTADVNLPLDCVQAPDILAEILSLGYVQLEFFEKTKLPIRGAITHGKCYHDDNDFIFGPAYIEAVKLEREAIYPRIIISDSIINDYKGYPEGNGDVKFAGADQDFYKVVKKDPYDNKHFVDYMGIFLSDPDSNYHLFLCEHKNFIINNLEKYKLEKKEYDKYIWLRNYHNRTVSELTDCEHFLIP